MFAEAVAAVRAGEIVRARDLLSRLLRADSANPDYWLWMSAVVESERESVFCLRSILKLRPNHPTAKLGLSVLGQISSGVERFDPYRQQRARAFPHQSAGRINSMAEWWKVTRNRENAAIMVLGAAAIVIVMVIVLARVSLTGLPVASGSGMALTVSVTPAGTVGTPESTSAPSPTLHYQSTPSNQLPLEDFLGVHPTPTAMYGFTPMPSTGAMDSALAAYSEGKLVEALEILKQVVVVEPKSAQAHFLIAEIYRRQKKMEEAIAEYAVALDANPDYAPAYLGQALRSKQSSLANDYLMDLNRALELDPNLIDAYLERAEWYGRKGEWETAIQDLERAHQIAPENALVLIRLGRAQLQTGETDRALDNIMHAQIIDQTILEGYLGLGEAYNDLNRPALAVSPMIIYTTYNPADVLGWLELGEAYLGTSDYDKAIEACTQAVTIETNSVRGRLCRGQAYRQTGDKTEALADLQVAADWAPNKYATQLAFGQAQIDAGKSYFARDTLEKAINLAGTPAEKAEAMGWQGFALEAYGSPSAKQVWQELMNLEGAPEYWKAIAYMHFYGISTPTPGAVETLAGEETLYTTSTPMPTP